MSATADVILSQLRDGLLVPAAVTGGGVFLSRWPNSRLSTATRSKITVAGFAIAFLLASFMIQGVIRVSPRSTTQWLTWVPVLVVLGSIAQVRGGPLARGLVRAMLACLLVWVMVKPMQVHWGLNAFVVASIAIAAAVFGLAWLAESSTQGPAGARRWIAPMSVLVGLGLVSALDGSALLGQLFGVLAACTATWAICDWRKWLPMGYLSGRVLAMTSASMVIIAALYNDIMVTALGVSLMGWLLVLANHIPALKRITGGKRTIILCLMAVAIQAGAVMLVAGLTAAADPYGGYY